MINKNLGITLVTHDKNPLQAMLLAPFVTFEGGRTILRHRANDRFTMHMAVAIAQNPSDLAKILPVMYRLDGGMNADFKSDTGITIESRWYNVEYDRVEHRHGIF
jgi:hypothetical protein